MTAAPTVARVPAERLAGFLANAPAWTHDAGRNALFRRLRYPTFGDALGAMVRIGLEADKADHHPEWSNVYGTVDIWLTTHDANGISDRDLALAATIDRLCPPE